MPGRTIENGYGKEHKRLRAEYARRMEAGEGFDCWRCGKPVDPAADWDLGHDDYDRSVYRGPEHVKCNRGSVRLTPAQLKSKRWYGPPRNCEICGVTYRPSALKQRSCGRVCGAKLSGRNRPSRPKAMRTCLECGQEFEAFTSSQSVTCSRGCGARWRSRQSTRMKTCKICGQSSTKNWCSAECWSVHMRNRYRERVGIPLDAPLYTKAVPSKNEQGEQDHAGSLR